MSEPTISLIIPVYKVERYLRRCLDSVIRQTWTNLEILLVNDGSPDACGAICEEYAAKDARILVIHQPNMGLSAARNTGLDRAGGEYIGFVDSDDRIEPDMFERLLAAMREESADIAVCGYRAYFKRGALDYGTPKTVRCDAAQGLELLVAGAWFKNFVWNKLFRAELFAGIRFPAGKRFEDIPVMYKLFERASGIMLCSFTGYHYVGREDSIIGVRRLRYELDACEHHIARYLDAAGRYPRLAPPLVRGMLETFMHSIFIGFRDSRKERRAARLRRREFSSFLRSRKTELRGHACLWERCALRLVRANNLSADCLLVCGHILRKISARILAAASPAQRTG